MSNGEAKKVSVEDIQLVQNLIERCIQLYMSQKEAVSTLLDQAKIEPGFTELVWQKLEMENPDFFKAYHLRLIVKDQILRFNQLLIRQVELMRQLTQTELVSIPHSDPSQIHSMHDNLPYQSQQQSIEPQNMHQAINYVPDVYTNRAPPMQQHCMQVPVINNMQENNMLLAQSSNVGMMQGMSGPIPLKNGCGYVSNSPLIFSAANNGIGIKSSSFTGGESNSQVLNEIFDTETNSFGGFGQMPRNFSFSDLTADFSNSADILESYLGSPFMGADVNIMSPHIPRVQQGPHILGVQQGPHIPGVQQGPHIPGVQQGPHIPGVQQGPHIPRQQQEGFRYKGFSSN